MVIFYYILIANFFLLRGPIPFIRSPIHRELIFTPKLTVCSISQLKNMKMFGKVNLPIIIT